MKLLLVFALMFALALAAEDKVKVAEEKAEEKTEEEKPVPAPANDKPVEKAAEKGADKPAEKSAEKPAAAAEDDAPAEKSEAAPANEKPETPASQINANADAIRGLSWPLPDTNSEGDLILHGAYMFERVADLHKKKVEEESDKVLLSHGRRFLHLVAKFLDDTPDFKVMPIICRDMRNLNTSRRWEIEIENEKPIAQPDAPAHPKAAVLRDQPISAKDQPKEDESEEAKNVTATTEKNNETLTTEKPIESTTAALPLVASVESFETKQRNFYEQVGENFGRMLLREYRKEKLDKDEMVYLERWIGEESVHMGTSGIYCYEGENVKEIRKKLTIYLEEKQ